MRYRRFGALDFQASALGFGAMRLPNLGRPGLIDEPEAVRMIRHAIDHGVNYIDTAYMYHEGNSERLVAKALKDDYRARTKLATKLPVSIVETPADFDRLLNEQLAKLEVEQIDFYLFHALRDSNWDRMCAFGIREWAERVLADGRAAHIGFSFHDNTAAFKRIVDDFDKWTLAQVQYSFMDEKNQAGTEGVRYAASKGLAVVVMEPLLGGKLADPPRFVTEMWESAEKRRSAAEWGLQWCWNQPEVSVVLSGMGAMAQVEENLASAGRSGVGSLSERELGLVAAVRDAYNAACPIPCTQCRYCMPCPNGIDIPANLLHLNRAVLYDLYAQSRMRYGNLDEAARASACVECRVCEDKCPQSVQIADWMPVVHRVLSEDVAFDRSMAPVG